MPSERIINVKINALNTIPRNIEVLRYNEQSTGSIVIFIYDIFSEFAFDDNGFLNAVDKIKKFLNRSQ